MTRDDFQSFGIRYFSAKEVTDTGARLPDVQARLLQHLDRFRGEIGYPVRLIKNGLTTGKHTSQQHPDGIAADIEMPPVNPNISFKCALGCGFKGIGLYWNRDRWVSMHIDLRSELGFWVAVKVGSKWVYQPLITKPI